MIIFIVLAAVIVFLFIVYTISIQYSVRHEPPGQLNFLCRFRSAIKEHNFSYNFYILQDHLFYLLLEIFSVCSNIQIVGSQLESNHGLFSTKLPKSMEMCSASHLDIRPVRWIFTTFFGLKLDFFFKIDHFFIVCICSYEAMVEIANQEEYSYKISTPLTRTRSWGQEYG